MCVATTAEVDAEPAAAASSAIYSTFTTHPLPCPTHPPYPPCPHRPIFRPLTVPSPILRPHPSPVSSPIPRPHPSPVSSPSHLPSSSPLHQSSVPSLIHCSLTYYLLLHSSHAPSLTLTRTLTLRVVMQSFFYIRSLHLRNSLRAQ